MQGKFVNRTAVAARVVRKDVSPQLVILVLEPAEHQDDQEESGPMPDDLTPNQVFGVGGRCRRGGEHQFEPDWRGRGFDYVRCRWCGKREAV